MKLIFTSLLYITACSTENQNVQLIKETNQKEEMISNYEPRDRVESVECFPVRDSNRYDVGVYFYV